LSIGSSVAGQVRVDDVRAALSAFISRFVIAAHQANEVPMELAACKSELACLTSAWKTKRQELGSQLNKYKSRCSALELKQPRT
jgi:hypothetical protein